MNPMIIYNTPPIHELAVTSSANGYPLAFIADWRSYTWWQSVDNAAQQITWNPAVATTVSDLAIYGHNLNTVGATVTLEGSDDGFAADIVTVISGVPTSDGIFYRRFTATTKAAWRITLSGQSAAVKITIFSLGEALLFEQPIDGEYTPIDEDARELVTISERGALLGAVISHVSTSSNADIKYLSDSWLRNTFYPLWESRLGSLVPFFWIHNYSLAPNDVFLMRMKSSRFSAPYHINGMRRLTLNMTGIK